jgi:hypothetical protein
MKGWVSINLLKEARQMLPGRENYWLKQLVIGNSSHSGYLQAGLSGNPAGAYYEIGEPHFAGRWPTPYGGRLR